MSGAGFLSKGPRSSPRRGRDMRSLHLCAGHGGGLLADLILGHTIIGAVERDPFSQDILRLRQSNGHLPAFPIYDDVRTFDGRPWRGSVDIVAGGIPCQGFSGAGKGLGEFDPRNLWPDALRILKETRAPWFFLENVANLTSFDYWGTILQDLAAAGYDARWCVLSAGDVGAPHLRKRIWLLATDTDAFRRKSGKRHDAEMQRRRTNEAEQAGLGGGGSGGEVADAGGGRRGGTEGGQIQQPGRAEAVGAGDQLADADQHAGKQRRSGDTEQGQGGRDSHRSVERADDMAEPSGAGSPEREGTAGEWPHAATAGSGWRHAQPDVGRVADGLANRLDCPDWWAVERGLPRVVRGEPKRAGRLRGLGNGQVPLAAATAWKLLGGP